MIDRVKALLGSGYSVLAGEVRKRLPMRVALVSAVLVVVAPVVFISSLRSASTVTVTHDQARTYAGILAQVNPVLLLALYVESTAQWATLRARRDKEKEELVNLSGDLESGQAGVLKIRAQIDEFGSERVAPELLATLEQTYAKSVDLAPRVQELMSLQKRSSAREAGYAAVVSLQLLGCLVGEVFALSSVLAPRSGLIQAATLMVAALLFLVGIRLFEAALAVGDGLLVQVLGVGGFSVLVLVYAASIPHIMSITVAG